MIRVRFFAALREKVGCESLEIERIPEPTVCALVDAIRARLGDAAAVAIGAPNVRIAVNKEFVDRASRVCDGDEVAFMPPITGG